MADVSSVGSGSTIDLLVEQYRQTLSQPVTDLQTKKTNINTRISALSDLKTKLSKLSDLVNDLALKGTQSPFLAYSVTSSNDDVATATAAAAAGAGSHELKVSHLAANDAFLSSSLTKTADSGLSAGTEYSFAVSVAGKTQTVKVKFDSTKNGDVLTAIANAVNADSTLKGVMSASVMSVSGSQARLVLTSKDSGSSNAITAVSGDFQSMLGAGGVDFTNRSASSATNAGFIHGGAASAALDSRFTLDGVDIVREKNAVDDVLSGVTISLRSVQKETDDPIVLQVASNTDAVSSKIKDFIAAYNDVIANINSKATTDATLGVRGVFASDSEILSLRSSLRTMVGQVVSGVRAGNPTMLTAIGLTIGRDGALTLKDSSALTKAATADVYSVSDLFTNASSTGIANIMKTLVDRFTSTGGEIAHTTDTLNSQITDIDTKIKKLNTQIDKKAETYRDQFARIQVLISQATQQQQIMSALL